MPQTLTQAVDEIFGTSQPTQTAEQDTAPETCGQHCSWSEETIGFEEQAREVWVCHEHGTERPNRRRW